ncbi:semaphorin-4E-like isoform X3 [Nelusetta ayraudi]|uniref:semaphorin-4E-like isoform X3 n=1 Tax=Nelusetta ayraudi TaxID=303726 RepID=UPI003F6F6824
MYLLSALSLLCGLMLHGSCSAPNPLSSIRRQTVHYHNELKSFREDGIFNYSTMVVREDLGVLLLGAREVIYALDLNDISVKKTVVYWRVTEEKEKECIGKGVYETFVDGQLRLKEEREDGKGKCPFDPFQRYSSLMVADRILYSATYKNFLGNDPVLQRNPDKLHSEQSSKWFNDPTFVHMEFVGESFESQDGADDKIYLFFSENAMEYDFYSKVVMSRVARVCKGDTGGRLILQKKWTSFLKASLDCSLSEASLPPIVQDVFLLKNDDWRKSIFYTVFTAPSSLFQTSLVCAFNVSAIRDIFNEAKFKTEVSVENIYTKWVTHAGEVPVPRPGACINKTPDSSHDQTLQFLQKHQLMDEAVQPMTGGPLLIVKGPLLTRIVVDSIMALDGKNYTVMFVGTENGYVNKAVNYGGEMLIVEGIQLYEEPVPISTLRLSESKGQIYAVSEFGAVQMPVSNCSRHATCVDCVLARDPYCAWDLATKQCSSVTGVSNTALQSLKEGDSTQCPQLDPVMAVNLVLVPGNNIQLLCQAHSNLAQVHWRRSGQILRPNDKYHFADWGLLIVGASTSDAGLYICDSVEQTADRIHNRTVGSYQLQLSPADSTTVTSVDQDGFKVAVILLSLTCFSMMAVIIWTWSKGHLQCFKVAPSTSQSQVERNPLESRHVQNRI